jgi:hypothetical protein
MNLSSLLWIAGGVGAGALAVGWFCAVERKRRLAAFVRARHPIPMEEQMRHHYSAFDRGQVADVLTEISRVYEVNPTLLRAEDRFDGALRQLSLSIPDLSYEMVCSLYRQKRRAAGKGVGAFPLTVGQFVEGVLDPQREEFAGSNANEQ